MPTATSAPAPVKPAPAPAPGGADGRALLDAGRLGEAAEAFAAQLRAQPHRYTVQLLVACADDTVTKAVQNVGSERIVIVPVTYQGRSCRRLCWGTYEDAASAQSAVRGVPEYFRRGGASPRVVTTREILP